MIIDRDQLRHWAISYAAACSHLPSKGTVLETAGDEKAVRVSALCGIAAKTPVLRDTLYL